MKKSIIFFQTLLIIVFFTACGQDSPTESQNTVKYIIGTISKGYIKEGKVSVYQSDGTTLIGEDSLLENSTYSVALNGYLGNVKVVATITKYENEASSTNEIVEVDNLILESFSYVDEDSLIVNITAVTDIASRLLNTIADKSKDEIIEINKYVSSSVGIGDIDNTKLIPTIVYTDQQNATNNESIRYGAVLLSIANDSNITLASDTINNKIKVESTLEKLKDAVLKSDVNQDSIEAYIEGNLNDVNFTISEIGTDIIDNTKLSLPSTSVKTIIDTIKLENIVAYADNNQSITPDLDDFEILGIDEVNSTNLVDIINKIDEVDSKDVDTIEELKSLIDGVIDSMNESSIDTIQIAINTIQDSAQNNNATSSTPSATTYLNAGVNNVDASNLAQINDMLNSTPITGDDVNTTAKIQSLVDSITKLNTLSDGNDNGGTSLSSNDITNLGLDSIINDTEELALFNDVLDSLANSNVDTYTKLENIASIIDRLNQSANGTNPTTPALTKDDLNLIGLTDVTDDNLDAVLESIENTADDGSGIDTLGELNTIVSNVDNAINTIQDSAQNNNATSSTPSATTYLNAGVNNVDASNLAQINDMLNSTPITGDDVNTTAKIQSLVDSITKLNTLSDGNDNGGTSLSSNDITNLGLDSIINDTEELALFNDVLDSLANSNVDTYTKLENIASIIDRLNQSANGTNPTTPALTKDDLNLIGLTDVTDDNLDAVLESIENTADDGSGIDTLGELNTIVSNVDNAINTIQDSAQNNNATSSTPSATTYLNAGVNNVDASNLAQINDMLNSTPITGDDVNTTLKIQDLVDSINKLDTLADGSDNNGASLDSTDISNLGLDSIINDTEELALLNDVLDTKNTTDVDTYAELENIASIIDRLNQTASGTNPTTPPLTKEDLNLIGLTDVSDDNLDAVLDAIENTADDGSGIDTIGELETIVATVDSAINDIQTAAQDNTATSGVPSATTYDNAGVNNVDSSNLAQINDMLNSAPITGDDVNTSIKIQDLVDSINKLDTLADGSDNGGTALDLTDIANLGLDSIINDTEELALLNDVLDSLTNSDVDTYAELENIASIIDRLNQTAGGTNPTTPALTKEDLNLIGLADVTDDNLDAVLDAIENTADDGSGIDTIGELETLVSNIKAYITAVTIDSVLGVANTSYLNGGDEVVAKVSFNEDVIVAGTPQLELNIGGTIVNAQYISGSNSKNLYFKYTITNENDNDGIEIESGDKINLNGGTIKNNIGNDANLTITSSYQSTYIVDTIIDENTNLSITLASFDVINNTEDESTVKYSINNLESDVSSGGVVSATLSDGIKNITAIFSGIDNSISFSSSDVKTLLEGALTLNLRVEDIAGNTKTIINTNISYDRTNPDFPVLQPTNGTVLRGTAEANTTVSAYLSNETLLGTVSVDAQGNFELILSPAPQATDVNISVLVTDDANNSSYDSVASLLAQSTNSITTVVNPAINILAISEDSGGVNYNNDFITSSSSALTISGIVEGTFGGSDTIEVQFTNGGAWIVASNITDNGDSTYDWNVSDVNFTLTTEGINVINAKVVSGSSDVATVSRDVTLDTTFTTTTPVFTPSDEATVIPSSNFIIAFDEAIQIASGNISLISDTNSSNNKIIDITSNQITLSSDKKQIIINPTSDLVQGNNYHIEIDSGAILDLAGNNYSGISDSTTWNVNLGSISVNLNNFVTDNIVNKIEKEENATILINGTLSGTSSILEDIIASDVVVSLTDTNTSTTYNGNVISYDSVTGAGVGSVSSGLFVDGHIYTIAITVLGTTGDAQGISASASLSGISVDTQKPTITISSDVNSLKDGESANITFTLSESSSDFTSADINVTNGTLSSFSGSGVSYSAIFTADNNISENGLIFVLAGKFTDSAGNTNSASSITTLAIDTKLPYVTSVTLDDTVLKKGDTGTITVNFSEDINTSTFTLADIIAPNITLGSITNVNGSKITIPFTTNNDINDSSNIITIGTSWSDLAGNTPSASFDSNNYTIDSLVPTVTITSNLNQLNGSQSATITFTLSEASTDFTSDDVSVVGGILSSFSGSGTNYSAIFTPTAGLSATGTIDVLAGVFRDSFGNTNSAATQKTITIDSIAPTLSISFDKSSLKIGDTMLITLDFSEDINDTTFTTDDITAPNGTLGIITDVNSTRKTIVFTPNVIEDNTNVITIGTSWSDLAGNTASSNTISENYAIDTIAPSVVITSNVASLKSAETASITFTLSEASSDFISSDINVSGGVLSNFVSSSATVYSATFTPSVDSIADGTIDIFAGKFTDSFGNGNTIATQKVLSVDTQLPSATVALNKSSLKIGDTATLTITFSETPSNFVEADDVTIENGALSSGSFDGTGLIYTATFTPSTIEDATNIITLKTSWSDVAGNVPSTTYSTSNYAIDSIAPSVTISLNDTSLKNAETLTITLDFSEDINDTTFTLDDITAPNGTLGTITDVNSTRKTIVFTPDNNIDDSSNVITIGTSWSDLYGNAPSASTDSENYIISTTVPDAPTISADDNLLISFTNVSVGDSVKLYDNGSLYFTKELNSTDISNGYVDVSSEQSINDGEYILVAVISDTNGNTSDESNKFYLTVTNPSLYETPAFIETPIASTSGNINSKSYPTSDGGFVLVHALNHTNSVVSLYSDYDLVVQKYDEYGKKDGSYSYLANDASFNNYISSEGYADRADMWNSSGSYDISVNSDDTYTLSYIYNSAFQSGVKTFDSNNSQTSAALLDDTGDYSFAYNFVHTDNGNVLVYANGTIYDYDITVRASNDNYATAYQLTNESNGANGYIYNQASTPTGYGIFGNSTNIESVSAIGLGGSKYAVLYAEFPVVGTASPTDMKLQVFEYSGSVSITPLSTTIANNFTNGWQIGSKMILLDNGNIVTLWASNHTSSVSSSDAGTMDGFDLYARVWSFDGGTNQLTPLSNEFIVNTTTSGVNGVGFDTMSTGHFSATALDNGNFVVVWQNFLSDSASKTYAQIFDPIGSKVGNETLITNTHVDSAVINTLPNVSALVNGGYVISWTSYTDTTTTVGGAAATTDFAVNSVNTTIKGLIFNSDGTYKRDPNGSGGSVDTTFPTITTLSIINTTATGDSSYAKEGDIIELSIITSEDLSANPTVLIAGNSATVNDAGDSNASTYKATYTMTSSDSEGVISYSVSNYSDASGNVGLSVSATTDGTAITYDKTAPTISNSDVSVSESSLSILTISASDTNGLNTNPYGLDSGVDDSKVSVDSSSGAVTFISLVDYERPSDDNGDNIYAIQITAEDVAGNIATKNINVTVTNDASESGSATLNIVKASYYDNNTSGASGDTLVIVYDRNIDESSLLSPVENSYTINGKTIVTSSSSYNSSTYTHTLTLDATSDEDLSGSTISVANDGITVGGEILSSSPSAIIEFTGGVFNGTTYGLVTSPDTGRIWLDRNLGASRVCTSVTDSACYGDYYNWGRGADGHQLSNSTKSTTKISWQTTNNSNFIYQSDSPRDWATDDSGGSSRSEFWSKTDGSSICPAGFRVPTATELTAENITDETSQFARLKVAYGGFRYYDTGDFDYTETYGGLATTTISTSTSPISAYYLLLDINGNNQVVEGLFFSSGANIRCIKDTPISIGISDTNLGLGESATINVIFDKAVDLSSIDESNFDVPNATISNYSETDSTHITFTISPNDNTSVASNVITLDTSWSYGDASSPSDSTTSENYAVNTVAFSGGDFNGVTYQTMTSSVTGRVWLDRNLGASQVCTGYSDSACKGWYFQWGRGVDGHQLTTSSTSSTKIAWNDRTNDKFITQVDWANDDSSYILRQEYLKKLDGSGICPIGFRVPTPTEFTAENLTDYLTAFSNLKFSLNGSRVYDDGDYNINYGNYWSSDFYGNSLSKVFNIYASSVGIYNSNIGSWL